MKIFFFQPVSMRRFFKGCARVGLISFSLWNDKERPLQKGVIEAPAVPDRFQAALSHFGSNPDLEPSLYISNQSQRLEMISKVMNSDQMTSADNYHRVDDALEEATRHPSDTTWNAFFLQLRQAECCVELVHNDTDKFPQGRKLWIDLGEAEERRYPYLAQLPNGIVVMPIFSSEVVIDTFFSHQSVWPSCWFPSPRSGSNKEGFNNLRFPVCGVGRMGKLCSLATVAHAPLKFAVALNLGQGATKIITYSEMLWLSDRKRTEIPQNAPLFKVALQTKQLSSSLRRVEGRNLTPRPEDLLVPQIAQVELHLMLFEHTQVKKVFVRSVDAPLWKRFVRTASTTQIVVITNEGVQIPYVDRLIRTWSFLREMKTEVGVTFRSVEYNEGVLVYSEEVDGHMFRQLAVNNTTTLRERLNYDEET